MHPDVHTRMVHAAEVDGVTEEELARADAQVLDDIRVVEKWSWT